MKKMYATVLLSLSCFITQVVFGQANVSNMGLAYSALIRDNTGKLLASQNVTLRFTILPVGSTAGAVWQETQATTTDIYGYAHVTIGMGTQTGGTAGSFAQVDFSASNYSLVSEVYTAATNAYAPLEKKQLQAVPYAKFAGTVVSPFAPGTMVAYGGEFFNVPQGWLLCDGRELDVSNPLYLPLFQAIGYSWGSSDGKNKFNLPSTAGRFLRGANNGQKNDPDALARSPFAGGNAGDRVGSVQLDAFQSHEHNYNGYTFSAINPNGVVGIVFYQDSLRTFFALPLAPEFVMYTDPPPTTLQHVSTETRPNNVCVNYIIKL